MYPSPCHTFSFHVYALESGHFLTMTLKPKMWFSIAFWGNSEAYDPMYAHTNMWLF